MKNISFLIFIFKITSKTIKWKKVACNEVSSLYKFMSIDFIRKYKDHIDLNREIDAGGR